MKNNILIILCLTALAWSNVITGYIKDSSTLEPISNVNIFIKKINLGTTSNSEGFFHDLEHFCF